MMGQTCPRLRSRNLERERESGCCRSTVYTVHTPPKFNIIIRYQKMVVFQMYLLSNIGIQYPCSFSEVAPPWDPYRNHYTSPFASSLQRGGRVFLTLFGVAILTPTPINLGHFFWRVHPQRLTAGTWSHDGLEADFPFSRGCILRWTMLIFRGVNQIL